MKRTFLLILLLILVLPISWTIHLSSHAQQSNGTYTQPLAISGAWQTHPYDLVYTVAFSSEQQPNGPLVVYRATGTDLHSAVPVIALARGPQPATPVFFPSPNGRYLALLTPITGGYGNNLNGAEIQLFSSDGTRHAVIVPVGAAIGDQVIWSANSQFLYYHSGQPGTISTSGTKDTKRLKTAIQQTGGYDEIHRVDLNGHDVTLFHRNMGDVSLRLIGIDRTGNLIMALARTHSPVQLVRLPSTFALRSNMPVQGQTSPSIVTTLPPDILPGNVLRMGSDDASVICERVLRRSPLAYSLVQIPFTAGMTEQVTPLFATSRFGPHISALNRSTDGRVLVMSQVNSTRTDLAAQGIPNVPAQETLLLADTTMNVTERLNLPSGGQIVQTAWTPAIPSLQLHAVPQTTLTALLTFHKGLSKNTGSSNASVFQQDEWMLEGHAGLLADAPVLPKMCYGSCPGGLDGAPHVSAAILHGVAYTESDWHQFNTSSYDVNGEPIGSPVESYDGGWGQFQQTWAMPPQCIPQHNCRSDASRIQLDQSYNIGTGVQSLISDWNGTAGVASSSDPNDPFKANDWFFSVWAYNGTYGNNPNDIPSSDYAQWYPGAPFRSVYEEYVWYFAAHPEYYSNGWTDDFPPSLGPALLPPQSDFAGTSDSFVDCGTCTIPDWTGGTYDREWVGAGAPDATIAGYFTAVFTQFGGENVVGLPRDNGGGAYIHRWGAGLVQDFGGGSALPGTMMLLDGTTTPYLINGGLWTQYVQIDHGALGCHGYPTTSPQVYHDHILGSDTFYQQTFQSGYITWNVTTKRVAVDVCS
ncbi:MAG: hypothetical protein ABI406_04890 [Ktedonobacteraceae bacterium]